MILIRVSVSGPWRPPRRKRREAQRWRTECRRCAATATCRLLAAPATAAPALPEARTLAVGRSGRTRRSGSEAAPTTAPAAAAHAAAAAATSAGAAAPRRPHRYCARGAAATSGIPWEERVLPCSGSRRQRRRRGDWAGGTSPGEGRGLTIGGPRAFPLLGPSPVRPWASGRRRMPGAPSRRLPPPRRRCRPNGCGRCPHDLPRRANVGLHLGLPLLAGRRKAPRTRAAALGRPRSPCRRARRAPAPRS